MFSSLAEIARSDSRSLRLPVGQFEYRYANITTTVRRPRSECVKQQKHSPSQSGRTCSHLLQSHSLRRASGNTRPQSQSEGSIIGLCGPAGAPAAFSEGGSTLMTRLFTGTRDFASGFFTTILARLLCEIAIAARALAERCTSKGIVIRMSALGH
jgi:hypothetical protein